MAFRLNPLTNQFDLVGTSGGGGGSTYQLEQFTLNGTQASAKQVTLSMPPVTATKTTLSIQGAPGQAYGVDFIVVGSVLSWNGLGLDSVLSSGDILTILHD